MKRLIPLLVLGCACVQPSAATQPTGPTEPSTSRTAAALETTLATCEDPVPEVAERAVRSVVNVASTQRRTPTTPMPFFGLPFPEPPSGERKGQGSGVIIDANRGLVLTNHHVIDNAEQVEVTLHDGTVLEANVLGSDDKTDIAVLELVEPPTLEALPMGDPEGLRLGETVLAVGNPFGVGQTVTKGIVSAVGRANMGIVDYEDFIQTDAAINPGNSGGALVNLRGELVGINTAILSRSGGNQGVGFAIPTSMIRPVMDSLVEHGEVRRGYLGVMLQDLDDDLNQALQLPTTDGVLVAEVVPGTAADKAGLQQGDVIIELNDEPVTQLHRFRSKVASLGPDSEFSLTVYRDNKKRRLRGQLGLLDGPTSPESAGVSSLGVQVEPLSDALAEKFDLRSEHGMVVRRVEPGSPAQRAGLQVGDVIEEVNRAPLTRAAQLQEASKAGPVLLLVRRGDVVRFVVLKR